jgi:hypothetical protein
MEEMSGTVLILKIRNSNVVCSKKTTFFSLISPRTPLKIAVFPVATTYTGPIEGLIVVEGAGEMEGVVVGAADGEEDGELVGEEL